jgi:hypothetical protein
MFFQTLARYEQTLGPDDTSTLDHQGRTPLENTVLSSDRENRCSLVLPASIYWKMMYTSNRN